MKKLILIMLVFVSYAGYAQTVAFGPTDLPDDSRNAIEWVNLSMDLGEIPQGIPVDVDFEFRNASEIPLLISNVQATCGCTTTYFPKSAINPGESAKISAQYNAKTPGAFVKTIKVMTNHETEPRVLTIRGVVVSPQ